MGRTQQLLLVVATGWSMQAPAEDQSAAAKAGILGLGVEYTYDTSESVSIRAGLNGGSFGFDGEESGVAYDFDMNFDSITLGVDVYPMRGPFRLSLGLLGNDNTIEAQSRSTTGMNIGGTFYGPDEVGTLRAHVSFDSSAPFAGLGWDWSRKTRRFGVSFDLGLISQGAPQVALTAVGGVIGDPTFEADLAAEQAELAEALKDLDVVPYGTLGFVFRF